MENGWAKNIVVGHISYDEIISLENLFAAWREFRRGKSGRTDVQKFGLQLEDNIFALHQDLKTGAYCHGRYQQFVVHDPKRRAIHEASVRDRLLHHAIVRVINPIFERGFIFDSWSCRQGKGTHRAVDRFQKLAWRLSRNNTMTVWVLKLDIRKYFASVDRSILSGLLARRIHDPRLISLLGQVVDSFQFGIPLGNLTSQLFANVYLDELDHFIKHQLCAKPYLRYCDDFVLLDCDERILRARLASITAFLETRLALVVHPEKIVLWPYHRGIDFLGFVCFPHHRVLRTKTKCRMFRKADWNNYTSYAGLLSHCRSYNLFKTLLSVIA